MKMLRIFFALCLLESARGNCLNGGIRMSSGFCVCPPTFTGELCQSHIFLDIGREFAAKTYFHTISKRSIRKCTSVQEGSASGSGSGSGSGMELEDDVAPVHCMDREKAPVNGRCEFTNMFRGRITLKEETFITELSNSTSQEFENLAEKTECYLDKIYRVVSGFVRTEVTSFSKDSLGDYVNVDYLIRTELSSGVNSSELSNILKWELDSEHIAMSLFVEDIDECDEELHVCDEEFATCSNTDGSYTCTCDFSYVNSAKEDERHGDECRHVCDGEDGLEYCLNGGVCHVTVNGTGVCTCERNFQGLRCEREWHVFLNATVGLGAALGVVLVIFLFVTLMLCARNRMKGSKQSNFVELESNSANGDFTQTTETNEIKGISNPYVSADEGITVATNDKIDDDPEAPAIQDDRL